MRAAPIVSQPGRERHAVVEDVAALQPDFRGPLIAAAEYDTVALESHPAHIVVLERMLHANDEEEPVRGPEAWFQRCAHCASAGLVEVPVVAINIQCEGLVVVGAVPHPAFGVDREFVQPAGHARLERIVGHHRLRAHMPTHRMEFFSDAERIDFHRHVEEVFRFHYPQVFRLQRATPSHPWALGLVVGVFQVWLDPTEVGVLPEAEIVGVEERRDFIVLRSVVPCATGFSQASRVRVAGITIGIGPELLADPCRTPALDRSRPVVEPEVECRCVGVVHIPIAQHVGVDKAHVSVVGQQLVGHHHVVVRKRVCEHATLVAQTIAHSAVSASRDRVQQAEAKALAIAPAHFRCVQQLAHSRIHGHFFAGQQTIVQRIAQQRFATDPAAVEKTAAPEEFRAFGEELPVLIVLHLKGREVQHHVVAHHLAEVRDQRHVQRIGIAQAQFHIHATVERTRPILAVRSALREVLRISRHVRVEHEAQR